MFNEYNSTPPLSYGTDVSPSKSEARTPIQIESKRWSCFIRQGRNYQHERLPVDNYSTSSKSSPLRGGFSPDWIEKNSLRRQGLLMSPLQSNSSQGSSTLCQDKRFPFDNYSMSMSSKPSPLRVNHSLDKTEEHFIRDKRGAWRKGRLGSPLKCGGSDFHHPPPSASSNFGKPTFKNWKPPTLRLWFLIPFLLFQLGIMCGIGAMQIVSSRDSGLTNITQEDSQMKTFTWAYLPTGIAIIVGICWAAMDLDVVRTEPYVRLSGDHGVGIDAIFDRNLLNPFNAFLSIIKTFRPGNRRRRYSSVVFCSVTAHIISFFVLPPLQSSLLSARLAGTQITTDFIRMLPFNNANPLVMPDLLELLTAAESRFFVVPLPESVSIFSTIVSGTLEGNTEDVPMDPIAVLPVQPVSPFRDGVGVWNTTSTGYTARLDCSPANVSHFTYMDPVIAEDLATNSKMDNQTRIDFSKLQFPISARFNNLGDDGECFKDIVVPLALGADPFGDQTDAWYYGGWSHLNSSTGSSINTSCNDYMFLNINYVAISYTKSINSSYAWDADYTTEPTFSSLLCRPHYQVAYDLPVQFGNSSICPAVLVERSEFESRAEDLPPAIFNSTKFEEYVLTEFSAKPPPEQGTNSSGLPTTTQRDFRPTISWLIDVDTPSLAEWVNTTTFHTWAELFLQDAFVETMNAQARDWESRDVEKLTLVPTVVLQRLLINPQYAKATLIFLGILVSFTIAIICLDQKRQTVLNFDPSSLASTVALACRSSSIKKLYHHQGLKCTPFESNSRLKLKFNPWTGPFLDHSQGIQKHDDGGLVQGSEDQHKKPFILKRTYMHLVTMAFAVLILCVVVILWTVSHFNSGLDRGSFYIKIDNVNELAWTIVPVLAVILIKFSWSMIDTFFRVMQPYISLSGSYPKIGNCTIATSYQTTLVGWITIKALSNKNYMLGIITAVSLLNEVLVLGIGALAKGQTVPVATSHSFASNLTMRTAPLEYPDATALSDVGWELVVPISYMGAEDAILAEHALLGAETAAWTTEDYAFCPLQFKDTVMLEKHSDPRSVNWTVPTTALHASAHCTPIQIPEGIFERIEVPQSLNSSDGIVYSYEFRDWSSGVETIWNSITYNGSLFRMPQKQMAANAVEVPTRGDTPFAMNFTGFWGPLWQANISENGIINLGGIASPGPVDYNLNNTRDLKSLPEIAKNGNQFIVGWAEYSRKQYKDFDTWYSPAIPKTSFLACNPTFEQFSAKVTLNSDTRKVLAYEALSLPTPIDGVTDLVATYEEDNTTSVSAGFGTAFMIRTIFETEGSVDNGFINLNLFSDSSSYVTSKVHNNKSSLVEGDNLLISVEKAFSVLFTQWAAVPDNVFVNRTEGPQPVNGYLIQNQMRIIISTTTMIIVVSILAILIAALAALPWWTKSWENILVDLEREPDVLGAVLGYICDSSQLMAMFEEQTFTSMSEMKEFLKKEDKKFRIGKFVGWDGEVYYGIEVEQGTRWVDDMHDG